MGSTVTGLTTDIGSPTSLSPTGSNRLGKDEFLKLLTAQLQNQDPLSPTDNQQFIAQLAQFSSVEQAEGTNTRLDSLLMAQSSSNQTTTATFIGKDVVFKSDKVGLTDTGAVMMAELSNSAKKITATISDSTGKVVRNLTFDDVSAGSLQLPWNGLSDAGTQLPKGTYSVKFEATDVQGNSVTINSQGKARVTGVSYSSGYPELIVNNVHVKLGDIVQVMEASAASTTTNLH